MSKKYIDQQQQTTFDGIRQIDEQGNEYWLARQLAPVLKYPQWRNFVSVLERAKEACRKSGQTPLDYAIFRITVTKVCMAAWVPQAPSASSVWVGKAMNQTNLKELKL